MNSRMSFTQVKVMEVSLYDELHGGVGEGEVCDE